MSISRAISSLAGRHPESVAVRDDDTALTWRELDLRTNRLARAYAELGVGTDSLVTVALPNSVEFVEACVAVWKLGATPQPLSPRLPPAELAALLALAAPALVVGLPPASAAPTSPAPGSGPAPPAPALPPGDRDRWDANCLHPAPIPTATVQSTAASAAPAPAAAAPAHLPRGFVAPAHLSDAPLPDAAAHSWKAPTSSGSTGHPKLIMAAASAHIDPDGRVAPFIPARAVQLVSGPLYHSAPFTYAMRGLMTGHTLVILPRFDERRVLESIGRHGITWAPLVPTMMNRIWRLPAAERDAADLRSLESILHLGSVCPPWLKRAWIGWIGPERVIEVYAGAESQGLTSISGSEWLEHPGSVGRPVGGSEFAIWGADDRPLPAGATGRIMLRRAGGATYAYRGAPAPQHPDGWDTLGDLGHLDADGYLYIADRADDLIITGGVNVYPAEVEAALEQHPAVRSAVVFGVPDPDLGEAVVALVDVGGPPPPPAALEALGVDGERMPGGAGTDEAAPLTEAALLAWLRPRLDPEKRPRRTEFTTEPVRDDAGKARRHLLRAERSGTGGAERTSAE